MEVLSALQEICHVHASACLLALYENNTNKANLYAEFTAHVLLYVVGKLASKLITKSIGAYQAESRHPISKTSKTISITNRHYTIYSYLIITIEIRQLLVPHIQ